MRNLHSLELAEESTSGKKEKSIINSIFKNVALFSNFDLGPFVYKVSSSIRFCMATLLYL